jgi:hypothetical protein
VKEKRDILSVLLITAQEVVQILEGPEQTLSKKK